MPFWKSSSCVSAPAIVLRDESRERESSGQREKLWENRQMQNKKLSVAFFMIAIVSFTDKIFQSKIFI
jgi:hypothetical protein